MVITTFCRVFVTPFLTFPCFFMIVAPFLDLRSVCKHHMLILIGLPIIAEVHAWLLSTRLFLWTLLERAMFKIQWYLKQVKVLAMWHLSRLCQGINVCQPFPYQHPPVALRWTTEQLGVTEATRMCVRILCFLLAQLFRLFTSVRQSWVVMHCGWSLALVWELRQPPTLPSTGRVTHPIGILRQQMWLPWSLCTLPPYNIYIYMLLSYRCAYCLTLHSHIPTYMNVHYVCIYGYWH